MKLFTRKQIDQAAYFAGATGALVVVASNYRATGDTKRAWISLGIALLGSEVLYAATFCSVPSYLLLLADVAFAAVVSHGVSLLQDCDYESRSSADPQDGWTLGWAVTSAIVWSALQFLLTYLVTVCW
jgi:hypothetical protein